MGETLVGDETTFKSKTSPDTSHHPLLFRGCRVHRCAHELQNKPRKRQSLLTMPRWKLSHLQSGGLGMSQAALPTGRYQEGREYDLKKFYSTAS